MHFIKIILSAIAFLFLLQDIYAAEINPLTKEQLAELSHSNTVDWKPCPDSPSFDCGLLAVPLDYQDRSIGYIQLPVTIHRAKQGTVKLGTLFMNFGGPWGDNVATLHNFVFPRLPLLLQEQYDLVTFAPRGIAPNAISCHTQNRSIVDEIQRVLNLTEMNSDEGAAAFYDGIVRLRALCTYDNLAKYASTKNTVQDMDNLRQALPQVEKIDYFGNSYGTRLGLAYLLHSPHHVGKMVLNSNVLPSNELADFATEAASGFETVFPAFFQFCAASSLTQCALYEKTPEEIKQKYKALVNRAVENGGIPTSAVHYHRPFSPAMLDDTLAMLVSSPGDWPRLAEALQQAVASNNADALMRYYRDERGYLPATNSYKTYDDYNPVLSAVMSKDYSRPAFCNDKKSWLESMRRLRDQYPAIGGMAAMRFVGAFCIHWPEDSDPLLPVSPGPILNAPKVLLVNSAYDSITPLSSTKALSKYLTNLEVTNKVLEWKGVGHASYLVSAPRGGCLVTNVNHFFATGELPLTSVCDDKVNPFIDHYHDEQNWLRQKPVL